MKLTDDAFEAKFLAGEAARLADSATKSLAAAEELGIGTKFLEPFPLDKTERTTLAELTALPDRLRKKLEGRLGSLRWPRSSPWPWRLRSPMLSLMRSGRESC